MAKSKQSKSSEEFLADPSESPELSAPVADPEPEPDEAATPTDSFSVDAEGRYVAEDGTRALLVMIGGHRYEHVAETADGKWIYAKS